MKVLLNEKGYISSYAFIGDIVDGIDVTAPEDAQHFEDHFDSYRIRNGALEFDAAQEESLREEQAVAEYRQQREQECFTIINRGQLWYDTLTPAQLQELAAWYRAWLDGTKTLVMPDKPSWL